MRAVTRFAIKYLAFTLLVLTAIALANLYLLAH
jgi:hypothetical protein